MYIPPTLAMLLPVLLSYRNLAWTEIILPAQIVLMTVMLGVINHRAVEVVTSDLR